MPISCHFRDCKALLVTSLAHVSGVIASVQTFTSLRLRSDEVVLNDGGVHTTCTHGVVRRRFDVTAEVASCSISAAFCRTTPGAAWFCSSLI